MNKITKTALILLTLIYTPIAQAQGGIFPITPFNGDTIESNNPLFMWYIADGGSSNERESYTFVLVEITTGQNADEAINSNIPVMRQDNLSQQQLMYPADAPVLKKNQWYAWQIQKYWSNSLTGKSEAWKFIITEPVKKESMKYAKLKKKNDGSYYEVYDGKIYFMLDEKYQAEQIAISVYDSEQKDIIKQVKIDHKDDPRNGEINLKTIGANFYELDLGALNKAGYYEMETYDEKGKRYILPFVVR